ncbi:MAG TPA: UDP-glucose/GDP-mannose dehydrogenase family protein, partial [Thermoanaerobaculia bacterium]|nr:UDP-glucose/GDP-mannose dehydrogenase family protein [Thermoanaerobaculia bacterium]
IEEILKGRNGKHEFSVVSNPEFLREGSAVADFLRPDRVVIGTRDQRPVAIMKEIYSPLYLLETPFIVTDVESAEMIKYASNGFLSVKISFINEIAQLCELVGADVHAVAKGMGLDKRIGSKFLHPGPGFGGSCFPKDTQAVADLARKYGARFEIIEAAITANEKTKARMIDKIEAAAGPVAGKTVGVLGISFKPATDDIRDSASIKIIQDLQRRGASVRAFDPAAMDNARRVLANVCYGKDAYDCAAGCDALVLATEWNEFRALDFARLEKVVRGRVLVDLRNVYEPEEVRELGWTYVGVGRG